MKLIPSIWKREESKKCTSKSKWLNNNLSVMCHGLKRCTGSRWKTSLLSLSDPERLFTVGYRDEFPHHIISRYSLTAKLSDDSVYDLQIEIVKKYRVSESDWERRLQSCSFDNIVTLELADVWIGHKGWPPSVWRRTFGMNKAFKYVSVYDGFNHNNTLAINPWGESGAFGIWGHFIDYLTHECVTNQHKFKVLSNFVWLKSSLPELL